MLRLFFVFVGAIYAHQSTHNDTSTHHHSQKHPRLPPPSHIKQSSSDADSNLPVFPLKQADFQEDQEEQQQQHIYSAFINEEGSVDDTIRFTTHNAQILFNDEPIFIKGVCYSPAPIGVNPVIETPYGDYFTEEYRALWERDIPAIAQLGANTVRVYGWNVNSDHKAFLDFCAQHNLWVIITFFLGTTKESPVNDDAHQQAIITSFSQQVNRYAGHPAILAWSFGNELNGNWNLFLQAFADRNDCKWNPGDANANQGGCWQSTAIEGPCVQPIACVYKGFFSFINEAAKQAHTVMGKHSHLIITAFADVDNVLGRIGDFEKEFANELDAWGVQLYRGSTFGSDSHNFLEQFAKASNKPLLVTEYGVDSYNDKCGFSTDNVCYNLASEGEESQDIQAEWGTKLSKELMSYSSADGKGSVAGGCIMAWADEQWKTAVNVKSCFGARWPSPSFDPSQCEWKAHVDCPNQDINKPTLCGYPLAAPFDGYVNEGYWGIVQVHPSPVLGAIDVIRPKLLYPALREVWLPSPGWTWVLVAASVFLVSVLTLLGLYYHHKKQQQADSERRRLLDSPRSEGYDSDSKSYQGSPEPHSGLP